jgi:hypothetical protein
MTEMHVIPRSYGGPPAGFIEGRDGHLALFNRRHESLGLLFRMGRRHRSLVLGRRARLPVAFRP